MNNDEKKELLIKLLQEGKTNDEILENKLFNTYSGMKSFCNRNKISISEIRTGSKIQIREFNKSFMDCEEFKWYFAGIIASDGTIDVKDRNRIRLCLKDTDEHILHDIAKHIFLSEYKLYEKTKILSDGITSSRYLELHVSNVEIIDFMTSIGITSAKTKTLKLNLSNANQSNIRDFIRGYFDGDGSVRYSEYKNTGKKYLRSSFVGGRDTMEVISRILLDNGIDNKLTNVTKDKYTFEFYEINIGNNDNNKIFHDFLYGNNPKFFLNRKFNKFNEVINK